MDEQLRLAFEVARSALHTRAEPARAGSTGARSASCAYCTRPRTDHPGFATCGELACIIELQLDIERQEEADASGEA
jgi:hypothetical protein